jgi:hypothetical protein
MPGSGVTVTVAVDSGEGVGLGTLVSVGNSDGTANGVGVAGTFPHAARIVAAKQRKTKVEM